MHKEPASRPLRAVSAEFARSAECESARKANRPRKNAGAREPPRGAKPVPEHLLRSGSRHGLSRPTARLVRSSAHRLRKGEPPSIVLDGAIPVGRVTRWISRSIGNDLWQYGLRMSEGATSEGSFCVWRWWVRWGCSWAASSPACIVPFSREGSAPASRQASADLYLAYLSKIEENDWARGMT